MPDVFNLLRPRQWIKNTFVAAPLVFSLQLGDPVAVMNAGLALVAFCAVSSAAYVLNDIVDRVNDRSHPLKANRPIAAGRITPTAAYALSGGLALVGLALCYPLSMGFAVYLVGFLFLQIAYSLYLKRIVVLDVATIAVGFVIRVAAGAYAVGVYTSQWIFLCTFFLAIFLALAKRRHETVLLRELANAHREVLGRYSERLLDFLIAITAILAIGVYVQYTLSHEVALRLGAENLYLTVPFVVFGVFRYLFLIYKRDMGGNPTGVLLGDRVLGGGVVLWVGSILAILYRQ